MKKNREVMKFYCVKKHYKEEKNELSGLQLALEQFQTALGNNINWLANKSRTFDKQFSGLVEK